MGGDDDGKEVLIIQDDYSTTRPKLCIRKLPNLPNERAGSSVNVYNGNVFICGGESGPFGDATLHRECYKNSLQRPRSYRRTMSMPKKTTIAASAKAGDKLYVISGRQKPQCTNYIPMQIFDFKSERWTTSNKDPIVEFGGFACSTTYKDRFIFVSGGWYVPKTFSPCTEDTKSADELTRINRQIKFYLNVLQIYDTLTDRWYIGPQMETRRRNHGCGLVTNSDGHEGYVVVGGYNNEEYFLKSVEFLRLDNWDGNPSSLWSLKWENWQNTNYFRGNRMTIFNGDDEIYAIGGHNNDDPPVEVFDKKSKSWSRMTDSSAFIDVKYASYATYFSNNNG